MWKVLTFILVFSATLMSVRSQFLACHDDASYEPGEGPLEDLQFTWLGVLQYVHVKNGTPHYFRVPRVVMITQLFALSTAVDAAQVPDGYALGNVIFGDYERDEDECRVTIEEISAGAECEPAVVLMPIADVLLHPEYKHFGAKNSVAILKFIRSIQSTYMVPACLPFKNYIMRGDQQTRGKLDHLDFISDTPRDFIDEEKEITTVTLLPREVCYLYDSPENGTGLLSNRIACSTGCGFHSGAPTLYHEHTGHWSVVALSLGGAPCPDPLRPRRPPPPPRHLLLYPYVPWITAAITGKAVGAFSKDDPFGFMMPRQSVVNTWDNTGHAWVGHWWMGGLRCYDRGDAADDLFRFYHEVFTIKPVTKTRLTYFLEIDAWHDSLIICVKVGMPFRLGQPRVWELDTTEAKVRIPLVVFSHLYKLQVEAWAYNSTESASSYSSTGGDDD